MDYVLPRQSRGNVRRMKLVMVDKLDLLFRVYQLRVGQIATAKEVFGGAARTHVKVSMGRHVITVANWGLLGHSRQNLLRILSLVDT